MRKIDICRAHQFEADHGSKVRDRIFERIIEDHIVIFGYEGQLLLELCDALFDDRIGLGAAGAPLLRVSTMPSLGRFPLPKGTSTRMPSRS